MKLNKEKGPVLKIEVREGVPLLSGIKTSKDLIILETPPLDEDFWLLRVKLSEKQAIVAFPKFGMFGIGFQIEAEDWNTNLPWVRPAKAILDHIAENNGDSKIPDETCIAAIQLLQQFIYRNNLDTDRNKMYEKEQNQTIDLFARR